MTSFSHVSAYRFVELHDLPTLRVSLFAKGIEHGIRGIFLLAPEGINLCLAGEDEGLRAYMAWLDEDARFANLETKWSRSNEMPYGKLRVRLKGEIIRMNHPEVRPIEKRAPIVDASTLKRWLDNGKDDEGREVVLIDTRNAFELDYGAFEGALDFKLERFSSFPAAIQAHRSELEGKAIVTYCTGGIRCEKAAIHMEGLGMSHVYQLDGGILRYFEQVGEAHYKGGCFVFDRRVQVTAGDMEKERAHEAASLR